MCIFAQDAMSKRLNRLPALFLIIIFLLYTAWLIVDELAAASLDH